MIRVTDVCCTVQLLKPYGGRKVARCGGNQKCSLESTRCWFDASLGAWAASMAQFAGTRRLFEIVNVENRNWSAPAALR